MSVVFYSSFVCVSVYANVYFKTILRECLKKDSLMKSAQWIPDSCHKAWNNSWQQCCDGVGACLAACVCVDSTHSLAPLHVAEVVCRFVRGGWVRWGVCAWWMRRIKSLASKPDMEDNFVPDMELCQVCAWWMSRMKFLASWSYWSVWVVDFEIQWQLQKGKHFRSLVGASVSYISRQNKRRGHAIVYLTW